MRNNERPQKRKLEAQEKSKFARQIMCEYDDDDEDNSDRRDLSLYIQETGQSMLDPRIEKAGKSGRPEGGKLFAGKRSSA